MTYPNQPKPNGAYTIGGNGSSSDKWNQQLTEAGIKSIVTGPIANSMQAARSSYETTALNPQEQLSGQVQALINDVNLLNGVPAYGACYQSWNIGVDGTGNASGSGTWFTLPFNAPLGPRKKVDILGAVNSKTTGGLRGYDPGLWELSVLTHLPFNIVNVGAPNSGILVGIFVYNTPTTMLFQYLTEVWDSGQGGDAFSIQATLPFVIPNGIDHFDVVVWGKSGQIRKFAGGTKFSGLWLRRVSTDVANTTVQLTVPDA